MSFDNKVKEMAYIASARRCCVCKKFKGRNIEVHHIVQKADGGEDTFENAIPLCFDCHSEAGHYNPRHPKGAKYSPSELKAHREAWYKVVEDGKVHVDQVNTTHQYFLTNSFDIVSELVNGEFTNFPFDKIKMVQNSLFHFIKSAIDFQKSFDREENIVGRSFKSLESYKSEFPEAKPIQSDWGIVGWSRRVTKQELKENISHRDFVTNYLLRHGMQPEEIAEVRFIEHGCGDSDYEEYYILRRAKVVLLAFTNNTGDVLACESLSEHVFSNNDFANIETSSDELFDFNLNNIPLYPGECLLIPVAIVLTPFGIEGYNPESPLILEHVKSGQTQDTRPIEIAEFNKYPTIGPFHQIKSINVVFNLDHLSFDLRSLKMGSLFLISRYWECGCCPHIFMRYKNSGKWSYIGELFSSDPDILQRVTFDMSSSEFFGVDRVKIMELENEITHISKIIVDAKTVLSDTMLYFDEELDIDIIGNLNIEIVGKYTLIDGVKYKKANEIKLQKVYHTLTDLNRFGLTKANTGKF